MAHFLLTKREIYPKLMNSYVIKEKKLYELLGVHFLKGFEEENLFWTRPLVHILFYNLIEDMFEVFHERCFRYLYTEKTNLLPILKRHTISQIVPTEKRFEFYNIYLKEQVWHSDTKINKELKELCTRF